MVSAKFYAQLCARIVRIWGIDAAWAKLGRVDSGDVKQLPPVCGSMLIRAVLEEFAPAEVSCAYASWHGAHAVVADMRARVWLLFMRAAGGVHGAMWDHA